MNQWEPYDDHYYDFEEEDLGLGCDFGLSEFCEDPFARDTGCTVNCSLFLQACEEQNREEAPR